MTKRTATPTPVKVPRLLHVEAEMKLLHRVDGVAGAALHADPDWSRTARALAALADASAELRAIPADPAGDLADEIEQAALNGEPIALLDKAAAHVERAATRDLAARAFADAQRALEMDLNEAARQAIPSMFEALSAGFVDLWAHLKTIPDVDQLATAEQAIAAGRADDWSRWRELIARNASLRQQQGLLIKRAAVGSGSFPEALCIPRPEDVFPHWVHLQQHGHERRLEDGDVEHIAAPWPVDHAGALSLNVAASEAFVRWALAADITPWIPAPDQVRTESTRLTDLLTADHRPITAAAQRREKARVAAAMDDGR